VRSVCSVKVPQVSSKGIKLGNKAERKAQMSSQVPLGIVRAACA
jgi:hypothetical protein